MAGFLKLLNLHLPGMKLLLSNWEKLLLDFKNKQTFFYPHLLLERVSITMSTSFNIFNVKMILKHFWIISMF